MSRVAKNNDPALWETVKAEGDKGGRPSQWLVRKAQLATQIYQERGGGYVGRKNEDNCLKRWTEEDWGTASSKKSGETAERYLPKEARAKLIAEEFRRTTEKKRADTRKGRQFSAQPADLARKAARHRGSRSRSSGPPTRPELYGGEAARH